MGSPFCWADAEMALNKRAENNKAATVFIKLKIGVFVKIWGVLAFHSRYELIKA